MEKTAVTIVMPAYRAERYIGEAVASVLAQTCPDWELLVVVDASPDESAAAAEKAAAEDPRVRILRLPANVGVAEARMAGVREAKTAWVAFLDSDDAWTPEKLERQLAFAEKTLGFFGAAEAPDAFIRALFKSPCDTVIIPMQDILGLDGSARMNYPGTIGGNWVWRMKPDQLSLELSMKYYRLNRQTERG